jgi:hypothetical protein
MAEAFGNHLCARDGGAWDAGAAAEESLSVRVSIKYSSLAPEITGKQLEFLKEIVPKISRVSVLGNTQEPANRQLLTEAETAAGTFRMKLQYVDIPTPKDIETAFRAATTWRANAIVMFGAFIFNPHRERPWRSRRKSRASDFSASLLQLQFPPASRRFARVCATLAMRMGKTSKLNSATRTENSIA